MAKFPAMPGPEDEAMVQRIRQFATGVAKAVTTDIPGFLYDIADKFAGETNYIGEKDRSSQFFKALTGIESTGSPQEVIGSMVNPENAAKAMIIGAAKIPSRLKKYDELVEAAAKRGERLDRAELFKETNVYVDRDQIPKTFISDKNILIDYAKAADAPFFPFTRRPGSKVGDIIDAPVLTHLYPEINITEFTAMMGLPGEGRYNPAGNILSVVTPSSVKSIDPDDVAAVVNRDTVRSVILHETQHAVQTAEGFGRGGNPRQFLSFDPTSIQVKLNKARQSGDVAQIEAANRFAKKANAQLQEANARYMNLSGEQEARFTEKTRNMTNEQLKQEIYNLLQKGVTPQTYDTRPIRPIPPQETGK
jgi:hypothetical protein